MTDLNTVPPPEPDKPPPPPPPPGGPTTPSPFSDDRQIPVIVYILFLAGFASAWVTPIVGVILAYMNRDTAPEWMKSHYAFQIRTFWIGLAGSAVSFPLILLFGLGLVTGLAVIIWYIARCALGINWLLKNEPVPYPQSWLVGLGP
jgi:uncharacterized membrane protein